MTVSNSNDAILYDWSEDATRTYYNSSLRLIWHDVTRLGEKLGSSFLQDLDTERPFSVDLDPAYFVDGDANFAITKSGGRNASFATREHANSEYQPYLEVTYQNDVIERFEATRDTSVDPSTYRPLGDKDVMATSSMNLIAFDGFTPGDDVKAVTLYLHTVGKQYDNQTINLWSTDIQPREISDLAPPTTGADGIALMLTGAEVAGTAETDERIDGEVVHGIAQTDGQNSFTRYTELPDLGDTIFATEFIRLDGSFDPTIGGKLGGFANTHGSGLGTWSPNGSGGWGGRYADGDSYSFRLNFAESPVDPVSDDYIGIGTYGYYMNNETINGHLEPTSKPIVKNEYVALQHMLKLNTVYEDGTTLDDGEFALWLNGDLVVHQTGLRIRDYGVFIDGGTTFENFLEYSRPHHFWHNVYFGGTGYNKMEHGPHMVSVGGLWVADKLPEQELIDARLAELNALPAPELFGEAADYAETLTALEDGGDLWATGQKEILTGGSGADRFSGSKIDFVRDEIVNFEAGDSIFIAKAGRGDLTITQDMDAGWFEIRFDGRADGEALTVKFGESKGEGGLQFVSQGDGGTLVRFVDAAPGLADKAAVDPTRINGVGDLDYLSGMNSDRFELNVFDAGGDFANALGVYEINRSGDIVDVRIVVQDTQNPGNPIFVGGVEANHTLGFFVLQDGATLFAEEVLNSDALSIDIVDGKAVLLDGGSALDGATIFLSHDKTLNSDGQDHTISGFTDGGLLVGFEDLARDGGSDDDFQDVLFTVEPLTIEPMMIV